MSEHVYSKHASLIVIVSHAYDVVSVCVINVNMYKRVSLEQCIVVCLRYVCARLTSCLHCNKRIEIKTCLNTSGPLSVLEYSIAKYIMGVI